MTVQEFFTKYNGKGIDFDNYYGFQCVDLYRQYVKECLEYSQSPAVQGAYQIWDTYLKDNCEAIKNTPDGIPQLGDIIIWNKLAGNGFGHVAVFSFGDVNSFVSFDQNWPVGSLCHFQSHNYTNVLGWLRPKKFILEHPAEALTNPQAKIDIGITGKDEYEHDYGIQELQAVRSIIGDRDKEIYNLKSQEKPLDMSGTTPDIPETAIEPKFINPIARLLYELAKAIG